MHVRRFNAQYRSPDWNLVINQISKNSEMTYKEIAECCGLSTSFVSGLSNDNRDAPEMFDKCFKLLDLWHRVHQNTIPFPVIK